jgi:methyl-accepting chemotaxis protein
MTLVKLNRFKIRTRLAVGFVVVLLLVGAGALAGLWRLGELGAIVDRVVAEDAAKLVLSLRWERNIAVNLVRTHNSMLIDDKAIVDGLKRDMDTTSARISELQKQIEAAATTDEEKRLLSAIGAKRAGYRDLRADMLKRRSAGANVQAELDKSLEPVAESYLVAVRGFVAHQQKQLDAAKAFADDAVRRTRVLMAALFVIGVGVAIAAAVLLARSILGPIGEAHAGATRIAEGDLTREMRVHGSDEVADLMKALAQMQEGLRRIAGDVRRAADTVNTASQEIAQGHTDLSARTEEQASSLEETAASMEQMTATVGQNAENARKANQLASGASDVAVRGGQVVGEVVATMTEISASSKKIADIIGVIDGIAFQTNILALNAAVEAARAGEQGRGFAVVASEVRSLAQRSAEAAKEIRQLIAESVARVDAGTKQVAQAGHTIAEVVSSVKDVNNLVAEISAASQEQSQGIAQVSDTVQQLEKVTQQNAAMVEEATAAAGSLEEQAALLIKAIGTFKLADQGWAAAPARAAKAAAPIAAVTKATAPKAAAPKAAPKAVALPKRAPKEAALERKPAAKRAAAGGGKAEVEGWEEF